MPPVKSTFQLVGRNGLEPGLESGWHERIKAEARAPAASYRVWIDPNKINHLAERQINDLAYASRA